MTYKKLLLLISSPVVFLIMAVGVSYLLDTSNQNYAYFLFTYGTMFFFIALIIFSKLITNLFIKKQRLGSQ
jgi:hypothetical protein